MAQQIAMTVAILNTAPTTKDVLEIPEVRNNWVATYNKVYGKEDGAQRFEAEKIMFLQKVGNSKQLADCSKASLYAAFTELAISGLTLRDDLAYIIPYGKVAQFTPGWKGRLEQITEMQDVVFAHEPIVVREGDEFQYEKGMNPRVIKHAPLPGNEGRITDVYFVIDFTHGTKVFFMDRAEVLNIRDRYSKTYKSYIADCKRFNQAVGNTFMKPGNGYDITVEPPMWVSSEAQAFKKTIVKRVYGTLPKLPKHKFLDAQMSARGVVDEMENEPEDAFRSYTEVRDNSMSNGEGASQNQQDGAPEVQGGDNNFQPTDGGGQYNGF